MSTNGAVSRLLEDPVAQELLRSRIPARLAYTWKDGTPRVIPINFHWNGSELVMASPPGAPKLKVLSEHPDVAITIDSEDFPHRVLLLRGQATVEEVEGVPEEYAAATKRYLGAEQGQAWLDQIGGLVSHMYRIVIRPTWVHVMDFESRFPSAIVAAMEAAG